MIQVNKIAVWMDHANAQLMIYTKNEIRTSMIESKFNHEEKEATLVKSEKMMHNKENHFENEYYKLIIEDLKNYNDILLFGPTTAKSELSNLMKLDNRFANVKVEVKQADQMTENQKHAFIKEYFTHIN